MTVEQWRRLSPNEQSLRWPTLTHAERDAIIQADKNVLRDLLPADQPQAKTPSSEVGAATILVQAAQRASVVRPDRATILAEVRQNSCYPTLRSFIEAMAAVGCLAAGVSVIAGLNFVSSNGAMAFTCFASAAALVVVSLVGRQSSLLLVDLVDLHLMQEARRRADNRS